MKIFKRKQFGVTLLELMVSMGIGVILMLAIGRVYVMATKDNSMRTLRGELDEASRQIFSIMARDISLAGFVDNFDGNNKILVRSGNIKDLFNREKESTALSLLTQKNYMLPVQGDDKHLTIIYQARNSEDSSLEYNGGTNSNDYRSLSGAYQTGVGAGADNQSGWGMNCNNAGSHALINANGERFSGTGDAGPEYVYLKQDFVFDEGNKTFSCGMKKWNDNYITKNNSADSPPDITETGMMKSLVGDKDAKDMVTSVHSVRFRYTVTASEHKSTDTYTVAESVAGYYTDKILNYKGVRESKLGWGGVTGVEVCIVLAAAPTFSKQKIIDIATIQPTIPTCERNSEDSLNDVSSDSFKDNEARPAGDNRYYERYVRTLSAHNALYLR